MFQMFRSFGNGEVYGIERNSSVPWDYVGGDAKLDMQMREYAPKTSRVRLASLEFLSSQKRQKRERGADHGGRRGQAEANMKD